MRHHARMIGAMPMNTRTSNRLSKAALALSAIALVAAPALPAAAQSAKSVARAQDKLAEMLDGRVAGEPESCIPFTATDRSEVLDGTAIVYRRGNTVWVNVPRNPEQLDDNDTLVIKRRGSSLCKQDMIFTTDTQGRFYTGSVMLNDFVPYRKEG
jgi:hypothetical protein